MTDYERRVAALKFILVITGTSHPVTYTGVGKLLSSTPVITRSALGNGVCLFNSFSMLLTGRDTYSTIIHHIVCNYISNPVKYKWLQAYIPSRFKCGKDYIIANNMCNFSTWGTEVEIIALAQISGFDMYVYTKNSGWLCWGHCIDIGEDEKLEHAFFMSNESRCYINPDFDACKFS